MYLQRLSGYRHTLIQIWFWCLHFEEQFIALMLSKIEVNLDSLEYMISVK